MLAAKEADYLIFILGNDWKLAVTNLCHLFKLGEFLDRFEVTLGFLRLTNDGAED